MNAVCQHSETVVCEHLAVYTDGLGEVVGIAQLSIMCSITQHTPGMHAPKKS